MTVAIAWVRALSAGEELVFVSDSRLSGDGTTFDCSPKVLTLPRGDCAICFGGYTGHAFPMMLQLSLAIGAYEAARRRSLDVIRLLPHALKVISAMTEHIANSPAVSFPQSLLPQAHFIFGGYSSARKEFRLWSIRYSQKAEKFVAAPCEYLSFSQEHSRFLLRRSMRREDDNEQCIGRVAFAGDQAPRAKELLLDRFNGADGMNSRLDMQPFEVVRDMLRDPNHTETIGGAPQVVKVYQYMHSTPLAVYWPNRASGTPHLHGRPCLGYERIDVRVLDPDTLRSEEYLPVSG